MATTKIKDTSRALLSTVEAIAEDIRECIDAEDAEQATFQSRRLVEYSRLLHDSLTATN